MLLFPQMRPEKKTIVNLVSDDDFIAIGIPAEWVPVVRKAGFRSPEEVKAANPNKLLNDLSGLRKKLKLEIASLKLEEVQEWINAG